MNRGFGQGQGQGSGSRSFGSGSSGANKAPKGFLARLFYMMKLAQLKTILFYRKFRTILWFGSTGFIFVVAPFAFSHFLEISEELQQLSRQGAEGMLQKPSY